MKELMNLKKEIIKIGNANNWESDVRIDLLQKLINLKITGNHYEKVIDVKNWLIESENICVLLNTLDQHEKWVLGWLLPNLTIEFRGVLESGAFNPNFDGFFMPATREVMEFIRKKDEPAIKLEVYERDYAREEDVPTYHKLEHGKISVEYLE